MKLNEVIIKKDSDPLKENHIRSGFKIIEINEGNVKVKRIHAYWLEKMQEWHISLKKLEGYRLLPENTQLPLL